MGDFDREHIWHPYTSMTQPLATYPVASAEGVRIQLQDGRELIDGMASWWCAIHGYNHPVLNAALEEQMADFSHVMFGGFSHEPATRLAQQLVEMAPAGLDSIFFSDSGSVSVEVAMKMAIQFWHNQGRPGRNKLLTVRGGYHGDTFGAMSVCDPITGMHSIFTGVLQQQFFAARPESRFGEGLLPGDLGEVEALLKEHLDQIGAVIVEPIVQGAGGMWFYSAEYLSGLAELCHRFDVLLILDEIATGFGRTGKLFGCEHAGVTPDIMCVGKALTGGTMSLAATLATRRVRDGLSSDGGVLMHGPTFMANALACASASASLNLLLGGPWQETIHAIESQLKSELATYANHTAVAEVRALGAIGVVEMKEPVDVEAIQRIFVEEGVWIRPFGRLVYVMPPYVIDSADLTRLTAAIGVAIDRL